MMTQNALLCCRVLTPELIRKVFFYYQEWYVWADVYLSDIVYLVTYLNVIISVYQRKYQIPVTILIQLIISSDTYVKI